MKNRLLYLAQMFLCFFFDTTGQETSLSIHSGYRWPQSDFYLNYQAVENDKLRVTYPDGEGTAVERYSFKPLWTVGTQFSYQVKNPRKRGRSLIYTVGLGFSQTSILIDQPRRVLRLSDPPAFIKSGAAREKKYAMGYLSIPLGIAKRFKATRSAFYWELGLELENNILLYKKATTAIEGEIPNNFEDARTAAIRDYWVALQFLPKAGWVIAYNWDVFVSAQAGVVPLNLMEYDQFLFNQATILSYEEVKAFEKTNTLNFLIGFKVGVSYSL